MAAREGSTDSEQQCSRRATVTSFMLYPVFSVGFACTWGGTLQDLESNVLE